MEVVELSQAVVGLAQGGAGELGQGEAVPLAQSVTHWVVWTGGEGSPDSVLAWVVLQGCLWATEL